MMGRKVVDINKLLEDTAYLDELEIESQIQFKRIDIDALLDHQEICELCDQMQD
jgi:hypothetical protein